jgi:hypothetical protein
MDHSYEGTHFVVTWKLLMGNDKRQDKDNVVYLNPIQKIRRLGYAQVAEAADGEATCLVGADGDAIAVLGRLGNLPALEVGDWVQVLETTFGASIVMRIEVTRYGAAGKNGVEADSWHEYFTFPAMRDISIKVVWSGWIMHAHDEKYILLEAEAFTLKDQDNRLMHFVKDNGAMGIRSDNGKVTIRMESVIISARRLCIKPYTQASGSDDHRS